MADNHPLMSGNELRGLAGSHDYDSPETRQRREQDYQWSAMLFSIKIWSTRLSFWTITPIVGLIFVLFAAVFIAHYIIPQWGWLSEDDLSQLGMLYGYLARWALPALIVNSWAVAYISRRWASSTQH